MIELFNKKNGDFLGNISEEGLQFLVDNLEEESLTDDDYYLNETTLEMLKEKGLHEDVSKIIAGAMDENGEVDIQYKPSMRNILTLAFTK
jgi:hypothetical protein